MISIVIGASAQKPVTMPKPGSGIIKVDPNKKLNVKTKWLFEVNKLPLNGNYIKDLTAKLNITLEIKDEVNYGKTLYFKSTMPINKIEFIINSIKTTSLYDDGTTAGHFYIEKGLYALGLKKGYKLLFYFKGIDEPIAEGHVIPLTTFN